jgi:cell wall-associated NlpC family hydrolase
VTQDEQEFVNSLIGLPWKSGANGPDAYDCWGIAQAVQGRLFLRQLPDIRINAEDVRTVMREIATTKARMSWTRADGPTHGRLVEMSSGRHPYHVGVYLDVDGGGILHSQNPAGVCFDRIATLQAAGWRRFTYNEWIG